VELVKPQQFQLQGHFAGIHSRLAKSDVPSQKNLQTGSQAVENDKSENEIGDQQTTLVFPCECMLSKFRMQCLDVLGVQP
jgi:hypothetical protein